MPFRYSIKNRIITVKAILNIFIYKSNSAFIGKSNIYVFLENTIPNNAVAIKMEYRHFYYSIFSLILHIFFSV